MRLNKEEKELLRSVEKGEWRSIPQLNEQIKKYEKYARNTFRRSKRINIRITERDLINIKKRALQEGIPYQTLIASILHKFATGQLGGKAEQA